MPSCLPTPEQDGHQKGSFSPANITKGSVVVYVERVVVLGLAFATSVLLARALPEDDYGIYRLAIGLTTLGTYVVGLGLESVVSRFLPEFLAGHQARKATNTVSSALGLRAVALALLLGILAWQRHTVGALLKADVLFDDYYWAVAVYVASRLLSSLGGRSVLTSFGERYLVGYVTMGSQALLTGLLALAVTLGDGIGQAISALAVSSVFELAVYALLVVPRIRRMLADKGAPEVEQQGMPWRRMVPFGVYNLLWQQGQAFREYAADSYVIALYADPAAVAYYGIATVIPQLMRSFNPGRMLTGVLMPEFVRLFTLRGIGERLGLAFRLLNILNALVYVPLAILFLGLANSLLPFVYGRGYEAAVPAALVLILLTTAQCAADPYYLLSQVVERPQVVFYSSIWGVFNLVADFLLIPRLGIIGAAVATGSSGVLILAYFSLVLRRELGSGFDLPWAGLGRVVLNCIPLTGAMILVRSVGLFSVLGMFLTLVGLLSYPVALSLNKVFKPAERELLDQLIPIRLPFI